MKTTVLIVAAFLLAVTLSIAGASEIDKHTNQDMAAQSLDTEEEAVLREIALIYITLNNLESLGLVDPGTSEMFAAAADLGTDCANLALLVCGQGKVCWICIDWDGDNGGNCSFACDTGSGCTPAPPCGGTSSLAVL